MHQYTRIQDPGSWQTKVVFKNAFSLSPFPRIQDHVIILVQRQRLGVACADRQRARGVLARHAPVRCAHVGAHLEERHTSTAEGVRVMSGLT